MSTADQYIQLSSLPEDVRRQVLDLIAMLMAKRSDHLSGNEVYDQRSAPSGKRPIAGLMKGRIIISDDFDAPLDDFKEYME